MIKHPYVKTTCACSSYHFNSQHWGAVVLMDGDVRKEERGGASNALQVKLEGIVNKVDVKGDL